MGLFDKARNKITETSNNLNKKLSEKVEEKGNNPRQKFAEYSSFPQYEKEEPAGWTPKQGTEKVFTFSGTTITVPKELDTCIQYRREFAEAADYYTERFKYKYALCVNDYDSFTYYFGDMYEEGLQPMLYRASSLLLPFGVFDIDNKSFNELHGSLFKKAVLSYQKMYGVEEAGKQKAKALADGITRYGMKQALQREIEDDNLSYHDFVQRRIAEDTGLRFKSGEVSSRIIGNLIGNKLFNNPEQKAAAYEAFNEETLFEEVHSDYYNSFYTFISVLTKKGIINGVKAVNDGSAQTMIDNLKNPMFPKDRIPQALATIISTFPFEEEYYTLAEELCGSSSEVSAIKEYFLGDNS